MSFLYVELRLGGLAKLLLEPLSLKRHGDVLSRYEGLGFTSVYFLLRAFMN